MSRTATAFAPTSFALVLERARDNDGAAFDQLWRALAPIVAGYLRIQGADDPDDLTSEVFLQAFRGLDRFEGAEPEFRSWLLTIAHRRLIDARRARQRQVPTVSVDSCHDIAGGDAELDALRRLADERVCALLGQLTPQQRDVILLRFIGGLSVEETGRVVGRPNTAVKALCRRGLGTLRRILTEAVSE